MSATTRTTAQTTDRTDTRTLVVGLGNPDRGDDALGPQVCALVAAGRPDIRVISRAQPADLLDLWSDTDQVLLVDATRTEAGPGTISVLEVGAAATPLPPSALTGMERGGSHAFGLAGVLELARALHRLPDRVVVVGVEAAAFTPGAPVDPQVAAALPQVVRLVSALLPASGHHGG